MVGWLSALEDNKVLGNLPYWNITGSLGDSAAGQNTPNAQWWLYHWYSSMTGDTVRVTPATADLDSTMQGVATVDKPARQARVIVGGGPPGAKSVLVKNIDPKLFGRTVHATVQQDRWSGMAGAAPTPATIASQDVTVGAGGTVTLNIPDGTAPAAAGNCTATGDRVTGRLGNALKLCGNNEYATLPTGVVSGLADFTISAWVNPSQNSTWSRVFDFGTGTATNMFLTVSDGGTMRFSITVAGAGSEQHIDSTGLLPLNTWSHVAVTLAGDTGTLYVNGVPVGTDTGMTLRDATITSAPRQPPSTSAYQIILTPGGPGHDDPPVDSTWTGTYEAENATITGAGWNINTEGTASDLGGFATSNNQDVGGLRTGSTTVITFHLTVPQDGDYDVSVFDGSYAHAADVNGPTNVYLRADGGDPREVDLPACYEWAIWNHGDTTVHLTKGAHALALSTVGSGGAQTDGDAIIEKIDVKLLKHRPQVYEAAYADRRIGVTTFWVDSATDGYQDLALSGGRDRDATINGQTVHFGHSGTATGYLTQGVNRVDIPCDDTLNRLTVSPSKRTATSYPAENGALTGTARVDTSYSQAHGGVVTGVGGGSANSLTFTVAAQRAGTYAMTVRFANDTELNATHYNPDLMTAPADISVDGGPTTHVNFANTFTWNQFATLTIPVKLRSGQHTIRFIANPRYNYDGKTIGVIYSGSNGVGSPLRSDTAPHHTTPHHTTPRRDHPRTRTGELRLFRGNSRAEQVVNRTARPATGLVEFGLPGEFMTDPGRGSRQPATQRAVAARIRSTRHTRWRVWRRHRVRTVPRHGAARKPEGVRHGPLLCVPQHASPDTVRTGHLQRRPGAASHHR
jgi:hypothetical protein